MACALNPVTVSLILRYISPPSHLSNQIPAHLLSQSLLQRHHFLQLFPSDDPVSYLSWPSADRDAAFELLESFCAKPDLTVSASSPVLRVSYTADQESVFAHAELRDSNDESSGIRLVFLWDERDEAWKYHNVALMPFPSGASDSIPRVALPAGAKPSHDFLQEREAEADSADHSDDAYWDAYGDDDDPEPSAPLSKDTTHGNSEDAYWAQYASVQGSGDSTMPSPLPTSKRKLQSIGHETDFFYHDDQSSHYGQHPNREAASGPILDIPYASLNIQPAAQPYDPHSPPSPTDLSDRLKAITHDDENKPKLNGHVNGNKFAHNGSTSSSATPVLQPVKTVIVNGVKPLPGNTPQKGRNRVEGDAALKNAIVGTYQLWKSSRLAFPGDMSDPDTDKELFLQLVEEAILH